MNVFTKNSLAIAMAIASAPLLAQDDASESFMLEEIIVTAQKREQNLNEVPVAVSVVSGDFLTETNTQDFEQMADNVPSLAVTNVANITAISIRGLGTTDNGGFEQSVGLFIDGVHQPKDRLYRATSFLDVGNVQVLKGPQGTLFGKNTTAGALMLTSNRPTQEFEGSVNVDYTADESGANRHNGGNSIEGFVSGGLTDTVSARLALRHIEDKGYFTNYTTEGLKDVDDKETTAARLSVQWDASEEFTALLKLEYGKSESVGEPNRTFNHDTALVAPGLTLPMLMGAYGLPFVEGEFVQSWNMGFDDTETQAVTLDMDWDLGEFSLKSITGYTAFDYSQNRDADWVALDLLNQDDSQDYSALSQEFRIVSPARDDFTYVAGIYYQTTEDESNETRNFNTSYLYGPGADAVSSRSFNQDGESVSLYANFDIYLSDAFTLGLGGNYSTEDKDASREVLVTGFAAIPASVGDQTHSVSGDRSVNQFNGSVKLTYQATEDVMFYGSVAQAFKSGGFDETGGSLAVSGFEFDDEEVISYELGSKGQYLDGRLNLNAAIFLMEVTDRQFSRYEPGTGFIVGNSGKSSTSGLEFDTQFLITQNFVWDLSAAYLEGQVDEPIDILIGGVPVEEKGDVKSIPAWSFSNHFRYDMPLDSVNLRADMYNIFDDEIEQFGGAALSRDSSIRTNLRFGVSSTDDIWEIALLANNITNEEVVLAVQQNAFFATSAAGPRTAAEAWVRPPRNFVLQGTYNF